MRFDFDTVTDRRNTDSLKWKVHENELPMWVADMDLRTAPAITDAIIRRAEHGIFGYSVIPDEWYSAYIRWWEERHHVTFARQELLFSSGVIPSVSCCINALTDPSDSVIILSPEYYVFYKLINNSGRKVLDHPLKYHNGRYSIDFDLLERDMSDRSAKLMIFSNPHNPIGLIWNAETLSAIGELAYKYGVTVVSDEIHCDLTDPGHEYVSYYAASERCAENGIICLSPTKTFNIAGIKSSAAVVRDKKLRSKINRALLLGNASDPNSFAVQAAISAFEHGGEWLSELREYLYINKMTVSAYLEKNIPGIKLIPSDATYLLWLDCTALGMGSKELSEHIRSKTGLFLTNGEPFGGDGFLRMNIACPRSLLTDGLERLKKAVDMITEDSDS
ncbi:MAG: pyridoxal phosphate-dependent aminotransferase [Oscillospiraceae bacterium]|nr:pyridoxal phosphate-dependent aminotransferase [Oscillospiraceae bacterium]